MSRLSLHAAILTLASISGATLVPLNASAAPGKGARESINGVDYYYEVHGKGDPVLLLHGGLGSIDMFRPGLLPKLAEKRKVIAVDLQGHGRTALGDRPFRLESIGDDMAVLVKRLGHDRVDVIGYSLGGGVGLRIALQQPDRERRLVLVSAPHSGD